MKILVFTAFPQEASKLLPALESRAPLTTYPIPGSESCLKQISGRDEIFFACTGIGTENAAITTTILMSTLKPDAIFMVGTAGGAEPCEYAMREGHKPFEVGDLLLGADILHGDLIHIYDIVRDTPFEGCLTNSNTKEPLAVSWQSDERLMRLSLASGLPNVREGIIFASNVFPSPEPFFDEIAKRGGGVLEMESAGVFRAAKILGNIPCMTVRAVSNLLDEKGRDRGTPEGAIELCAQRLSDFMMTVIPLVLANQHEFRSYVEQEIQSLIAKHKLEPHPEGGYYRQTHRSSNLITTSNGELRSAGTSIEFLLIKGNYSGWHTVDADETWYFHKGDPLLLHVIHPETGALCTLELGGKDGVQYTVPKGHIFASETSGDYSFCGCAVSPGFEFSGFRLIPYSEIKALLSKTPHLLPLGKRLVRDEAVKSAVAAQEGFVYCKAS